jgi:hypothetical protein
MMTRDEIFVECKKREKKMNSMNKKEKKMSEKNNI